MTILNNVNNLFGDDIKISADKGDRLKIAAAIFSINAYEALKKELKTVEALEFIFTPTFVPIGDYNGKLQLEAKEVKFKESIVPLKGVPFAQTHDGEDGVMCAYADSEGFLLGCEIFAPNAEELIAAASMALAGEMDVTTMKRTILAHPTFSEGLERALGRL